MAKDKRKRSKSGSRRREKKPKKRRRADESKKRRRRSPSSSSDGSGGSGPPPPSPQHLLVAAAVGDRQRCRELVQQGADVAYADAEGTTALHEVSKARQCIRRSLALPPCCSSRRPAAHAGRKAAPLHTPQACRHGHLPTVRLLLRRGADAGAVDMRGDTPAHLAARHAHLDLLPALLEAGGWHAAGAADPAATACESGSSRTAAPGPPGGACLNGSKHLPACLQTAHQRSRR